MPGMILGAPCFACIYALVGNLCETKLEKKNLPVDTSQYFDVDSIDSNGRIISFEEKTKAAVIESGENENNKDKN